MILKRTLPLLTIIFFLTGCFRQAQDTFDTVGSSQNSGEIGITQEPLGDTTPTEEIAFIDPNATEFDAESVEEEDVTATPRTLSPTEVADNATGEPLVIPTATEVIASATPFPTATEPAFITPEVIEEVALETATPRPDINSPTLEPSPTVFDSTIEAGECEYVVQDGDNLFRIAINNDVVLADMLRVNGLTEASIIQPGEVLTLPDCDGITTSNDEDENIEEVDEPVVLDDCEYVIQPGDTLFRLSLDFDVTLAELLAENDLAENAVIQPDQIIRIPNCVDGDTEVEAASDSDSEAEEVIMDGEEPEETIHVVEAGDTLQSISLEYGVTVNSIVQINTIPNLNNLTVGQQLTIPEPPAANDE